MQVGLWSMRYSTMLPQCLHVQSSGWVISLVSLLGCGGTSRCTSTSRMVRVVRAGAEWCPVGSCVPFGGVAMALAGHAPVLCGPGVAPAVRVTAVSEEGLGAGQVADERHFGRRAPCCPANPRRSSRLQRQTAGWCGPRGCRRHKCRRSTHSRGIRYQGVRSHTCFMSRSPPSFSSAGLGSLYAHTGAGGAGIRRFIFFWQNLPANCTSKGCTRNVESSLRRCTVGRDFCGKLSTGQAEGSSPPVLDQQRNPGGCIRGFG
jgi:hypothetical protein